MSENLQYPIPERGDPFQQYLAEVEPLVATAASDAREDRAFLGRLRDLLPSRTQSAQELTAADQDWLDALEAVAHRHQLSFELISNTGADDVIWLTPPHEKEEPPPCNWE